jgi:glycosyltransferase involved in cell wall biosynthesis
MKNKLAVVTTESLPIMPVPCGGGGVRIWGLAEALRTHDVEVVFFLPEERRIDGFIYEFGEIRYTKPELLHDALSQSGCDAVLFEQWQPLTFLRERLEVPVIVDLPGPLALEYYWRDPQHYHQHIAEKLQCFSKADYFICALERQRGYYVAWLTWAGITPDETRLDVVPFTYPEMPRSNHGIAEDEPLIFWGGMFWAWQELSKPLEVILSTLSQNERGQLIIAGLDEAKAKQHNIDLSHPHLSSLGMLPFMEFVMELKRAAVAVDLSLPTTERQLASDLRTGTALWAGTPCIVTPASPWAKTIEEQNAGWVLQYDDEKKLRKLIKEIVHNQTDTRSKLRGAHEVSKEISNPKLVKPLVDWLKNPIKRKHAKPFLDARTQELEEQFQSMRQEIYSLQHEKNVLQHELNAIRSKLPFRLYKSIMAMMGK